MKSLVRSQAARRRAAAAAVASVGAGILGTQSAEAGIVTINIAAAGSNGVNITGVNAGVAAGGSKYIGDFPTTGGGSVYVYNKFSFMTGVYGFGGFTFATGATRATPVDFAAGTLIDATAGGGAFRDTSFSCFKYRSTVSPNFGPNSFLGFKDRLGRYGYIETTWNSTSEQFQFFSAAYESVAGVGIMTPGAASVPEIDPSGLASTMSLVMGSVAMLEQRRRNRSAVAVTAAGAA